VMSTADSQLLLASAVATGDLPGIREYAARIQEKSRVWLGRALLVVIGCVGAAIPILHPESIFEFVSYAWGGMGAAFGPVTILALYWRRFNRWGAVISILSGTLVASIWALQSGGPGGIWDVQPATPGFIVSMLAGVVACLLTAPPSDRVLDLFDRATCATT
ncbi:MAG: sodium:proline symporter, partial [Chloroflexota bacterium]|nr:sodium:proline symporter [Chloroflexota bacterium]